MRQLSLADDDLPATAPKPRGRAFAGVALALLATVAALAVALPYLADREVAAASSGWPSDPARAFNRLDRAAQLDPLSSRPRLVAGVIALELGRPRIAKSRFVQALSRDGGDWFAWFGRGLAESAAGDAAAARAAYERARSLDAREPLLEEALARVGGRDPLTAQEAFGSLRRSAQRLAGKLPMRPSADHWA